ncbi:MAG: carboxypeptidase-like regulatory domain-containing protein [Paludibacteraceae bacterium]|nr:carboxypeptidase-like regulatory domain-containing protein [Paludibacteraceae bacterium]
MMRTIKYVVSTILIFLVTPLWGQRQLTIIDEVSKAPIPYASVCFGMDGKYSNEQGEVFLPDSISLVEISHISYESQNINIDATEKDTIELKPVISILPPRYYIT